ncbi:MAG TPA: aldehyde dehydrogenase family protein, partial [Gemmatimonadales bacterium]|nr:aldehyde dehydrogenase family protein [Gemmatimonadales bacterium]
MRLINHWIDNRVVDTSPARTGEVFDPATGRVAAAVAFADASEVDAAVDSARRALPGWRDTALTRRQRILFAYRDLVERHAADIGKALTAEQGKTTADAVGEVTRGLEVIEFATGIPHLLKGEFSENVSTAV